MVKNNRLAIILALITVLLWGTVAAVSKLLLKNISNIQLMFFVALFATISTFIIAIIFRKLDNIKTLVKYNWFSILLLGILGMGIQQYLYFTALAHAPVAEVNVLNYMWPIFIFILSLFLIHEKFSWKILFGFLLGILGVTIVITKGEFITFQSVYLFGYLLAIGAAFCWALFSVANKKRNYEPISSMFLFNFIGLLFMSFLVIVTKTSFIIPLKELAGTFYIGLFPTAIAFILWIKAMQLSKSSHIANFGHLAPFLSFLFIYFILKEQILISEIIGLSIIICGVFLSMKK